jgi:hypothetical protein
MPSNDILCYAPCDKVQTGASLFVKNPNSKSANRNVLISVADLEPYSSKVLGIRDSLVRIGMRIRILGSLPLTNGSGCGSGRPKNTDPTAPDLHADSDHWYINIILQR